MQSLDEALDSAAHLTRAAVRAGADAADALYYCDASTTVSVRLGALEDVESATGEDTALRVFVGRRSASVSTSDRDPSALDALVERAVAMAREAPEDAFSGLAPEDRLLRGPAPDLSLDDDSDPDPQRLREMALAVEDAARAIPGVTNSEGGTASHGRVRLALATSHGFSGGYGLSSHDLSASVIAGTGAGMQRDYDWHSARWRDELRSAADIGRRAGERAVARLNPGRAPTGRLPLVFDPRVGSSLVAHLIGAMSGPSITRRTSFLLDRLDDDLFPADIVIRDEPHLARGLRSRPFDGEGLPTAARDLVADGRVTGWLLDSASARQLGAEPTGHATRGGGAAGVTTSNVTLRPGALSPAALMADIGLGIYVTELIGQGVNAVTGDYSRGASGFVIRDGQIAEAVAEFTVAGNLIPMYAALRAADDLVIQTGVDVPTLRIDGMTVAGA